MGRSGLSSPNSRCYHGVGRVTYVRHSGGTRSWARVIRNAFRTRHRHTRAVVKWIIQRVIGIIPRVFVTTTNAQRCLVCVCDKRFEKRYRRFPRKQNRIHEREIRTFTGWHTCKFRKLVFGFPVYYSGDSTIIILPYLLQSKTI